MNLIDREVPPADRAFLSAMETRLRSLGARHEDDGFVFIWKLETKAGPLLVTPMGNRVLMRFADVDLARTLALPWMNPHSGKWNSPIFTEDHSVTDRMREIDYRLSQVIV